MESNHISLEFIATVDDDKVVSRELEGEAVILNLESGIYFGLDDVGTRIWELIQEHGLLRKVHEAMLQECDVTPQTLETDLLQLVAELRAKGLVSVVQRGDTKSTGF